MCCFVWIGGNDVTATTDINQFEVHIDRSGVDTRHVVIIGKLLEKMTKKPFKCAVMDRTVFCFVGKFISVDQTA
jgi:hypothetical protein